MSKHKTTGFDDGFHGRDREEPHGLFEQLVTINLDKQSRISRENREYNDSYNDGRRERDKRNK